MNKQKVIQGFIEQLQKELVGLKAAALATYEAATHEESKPENEYDTRALEASYLAGAQAKRAGEIDEVLSLFQHLPFKTFTSSSPVSATALLELETHSKRTYILLMPKGGGVSLHAESGELVQIVTPNSLLGEALLGLKQGDDTEIEVSGRVREYKILSVQ